MFISFIDTFSEDDESSDDESPESDDDLNELISQREGLIYS